MKSKEKAELKTLLILKHDSLDKMYEKWLLEYIKDLTLDEKQVLVDHLDTTHEELEANKRTCHRYQRALHGVFQ